MAEMEGGGKAFTCFPGRQGPIGGQLVLQAHNSVQFRSAGVPEYLGRRGKEIFSRLWQEIVYCFNLDTGNSLFDFEKGLI